MHAHIVVGLAFGDEGKGSWVDYLCRRHNIKTVVRFNGGAQALHHVTTEAGVTHGFSQFGSHSFIPGAKTLLSRFMLLEPVELLQEAVSLQQKGITSPLRTLFVSEETPIIPYSNILLNRIMESSRGSTRHGSCGLGIGLTQRDIEDGLKPVIRAGGLQNAPLLHTKLKEHVWLTRQEAVSWTNEASAALIQQLNRFDDDMFVWYHNLLCEFANRVQIIPEAAFQSVIRRQSVVFEGAQGALLDQSQGTFPYCTRSTTTAKNALTLLREAGFTGEVTRHGLLRAYGTRHGAGPFVTEADVTIPGCDNSTGEWQGMFRQGWFDVVAARTALHYSPVDEIAITNLDRLNGLTRLKYASAYQNCSFYDQTTRRLRLVSDYAESQKRTESLFEAIPQYEVLPGYRDEHDTHHQAFVQALQVEIGQNITALSYRKDHHKISLI